ncbi:MAG TPA: SDR family NAD(P)-dependent oxidoreductase, partial [Labilithrix sp.]|nr:SDR family NAD(P)-dependent oxidoreductase [Labilithrix sp.]
APRAELLLLSAKSEGALTDLARAYQTRLGGASQSELASVCAAAAMRRTHHDHRAFVVGENAATMVERLDQLVAGGQNTQQLGRGQKTKRTRAKTVFVYPGLGPQWLGMTKGLLAEEPVFRDAIVRIDALVRDAASWSVLDELEGPSAGHGLETSHIEIIQTTLFAIQVALTQLWRSWGIVPDAVVGHSMGEVAAAHAAAVLTLEDAVRVMLERSRLIHTTSGRGAMASIELPLADAQLLVTGREHEVSVGASNSPETTVLSGDAAALDDILAKLDAQGISHRRVRTTGVAGHGPQLEEARHTLAHRLAGLTPGAAKAAIYSTKTGQREDGARLDARYWGDQLREPVLFSRAVDALAAAGFSRFVELSPHPVLAEDIRRCFAARAAEPSVMPSMRRNENERAVLLGSLGKLHALGHPVDLGKVFASSSSAARLPTYPWQKERFWLDVPRADENADSPSLPLGDETTLERVRSDAWLYDVAWRALDLDPETPRGGSEGAWLVLCDRDGLGGEVATRLEAHGARCVRVTSDDDAGETLRRVRAALERGITNYRGVVHAWSVDAPTGEAPTTAYALTWRSLLAVAKACGANHTVDGPRIWIATRGAVALDGDRAPVRVEQSMAWGLGRVLANEIPSAWGGLVDLDPRASNEASADALVSAIVTGLSAPSGEDQLARRAERWFGARLVRDKLVDANVTRTPIRRDAAYLVTGGLGALGLLVAQNLVDRGARRVILVGRTPLPDRAAWSTLDERSPAFAAVRAILAIERVGASVTTVALDVADGAAVDAFFAHYRAEQRPIIAGVVHAAGVVRDQLIARLSEAEFEEVLAPKVAGAWNLHRSLGDDPLDFFVLFSSAAGVLGSPGQASYAAANVMLDALAAERARQGKAAQSVAWGPWADVGLAHRPDRGGRLALRGITGFDPATGIAVFERLSRLGTKATCTVLDASWPKLFDAYDDLKARALYRELRSETAEKTAPTLAPPSIDQLGTKSPAERHDAILGFLTALLGRSLGCAADAVDVHKPLNRLGIDSLMVMELANRTKSALGVSPRLELFALDTSTDELADHLLERLGLLERHSEAAAPAPAPDAWFFRPEPRKEARARVFCFPYAGGGPWVFGALAKRLPSWIELVSIQLPGRGTRAGEDLVTNIDDAVPPLVEALAPWLDKPFALFGYSVGGLVAFETARALRRSGAPSPRTFVVAASRAPQLADPFPELRSLTDEQFAGALRSFGGTPEEALNNDELMAQVLPILRADFLLIKGHAHREDAPLDCPIEAFGGTRDSVVKPDDLDGWRRHSSRFDLQLFDEGHFFMKSREAEIAAALRRALESCAPEPNLSNEQGIHA